MIAKFIYSLGLAFLISALIMVVIYIPIKIKIMEIINDKKKRIK